MNLQAVVATSPQLLTTVWMKGLATAGQYLVPVICLFGALMSFLRRRHRESLLAMRPRAALPRQSMG